MAGFTFKLETLLEQRKHAERRRQRELAVAQQALLRLQAELDGMTAVQRSSGADLRSSRGALSAALLAAHQRFERAMRHKTAAVSVQLETARAELDRARADLLDAARQRKAMEKLREREQARWIADRRRHERRMEEEAAAS